MGYSNRPAHCSPSLVSDDIYIDPVGGRWISYNAIQIHYRVSLHDIFEAIELERMEFLEDYSPSGKLTTLLRESDILDAELLFDGSLTVRTIAERHGISVHFLC